MKRLPLVGNGLDFRRDPIQFLESVGELGGLAAIHLGPRRVLIVSEPDLAREILVEKAMHFDKGPVVKRYSRAVFGDGLISIDTDRHAPRRRMMNPLFQRERITKLIAEASVHEVEGEIESFRDGHEVDLTPSMLKIALRIIGRALFSVDLERDAERFRISLDLLQAHVTKMVGEILPLPVYVPTPRNLRVARAIRDLDAFMFEQIRAAQERPRDDLLSMLVRQEDDQGRRLSDREIRDEVVTLFVAGHETTAYGLSWAWALLLRDEEALLRATEEARFATKSDVAEHPLRSLPYLTACVREALRLFPPAPVIGRQVIEEVSVGGATLRPGQVIVVCPYLMHRREALFDRPRAFNPERFLENRAWPKYAYLPFGAGARACIGSQLSLFESTVAMASILRKVDLSPVGPMPAAKVRVTLQPDGPVRALVRKR